MYGLSLGEKCRIGGIAPELLVAIMVMRDAYRGWAQELNIYHVTDGNHMVGSLHYIGHALDATLPGVNASLKLRGLRKALGPDFDVVDEKTHLHVEYQPKTAINAKRG